MSPVLLSQVPQRESRKSRHSSHSSLPLRLWVGCANLLLLGTASSTYGMFLEEMCLNPGNSWQGWHKHMASHIRIRTGGYGTSCHQSMAPQIWLPWCMQEKRMDLDVIGPWFFVVTLQCERLGVIWSFQCILYKSWWENKSISLHTHSTACPAPTQHSLSNSILTSFGKLFLPQLALCFGD